MAICLKLYLIKKWRGYFIYNANWTRQATSTVGTGNLVLIDEIITSYAKISSTFADGERIYYTIIEGADRENGLGTYVSSGNSIIRDFVFETIVKNKDLIWIQ